MEWVQATDDKRCHHCIMGDFGPYKASDGLGIDYTKAKVGDKYAHEYMVANGYRLGGEHSWHSIVSKDVSAGDGNLTSLKPM